MRNLTLISSLFLALFAGPVLADGVAPNYGGCKPTGKWSSISIQTVESDTLTVATVLPNPGWWNGVNPQSVQDGFEYCIAAEVAHRAGVTNLRVRNMAWDQFISGTAKDYDIAMASASITEPRKQVFDFSQAYFSSNLGVAVKQGSDINAGNIRSKKIGVLQGNMGSDWVVGVLKPEQQPALYQSQADMVTALMSGQVDAIISDTSLVLSAASNPSVAVVGQFELDQGYGVITPKGSPNSHAVDSVIADMKATDVLSKLSAQFLAPIFGKDPVSIPVWALK